MSEETEETNAQRVTVDEVLEAIYVLTQLTGSSPTISEIQVQVGSKSRLGRLTNRVILSMLDAGMLTIEGKQECTLSSGAWKVAEFLWGMRAEVMSEVAVRCLDYFADDDDAPDEEIARASAMLWVILKHKGLVDQDRKITPLGDGVRRVMGGMPESLYRSA